MRQRHSEPFFFFTNKTSVLSLQKISRPRFDKSSKRDLIKTTLIKNQERIKEDKERVRVRKSRYVESDKTYCYTEKFNIALSL